MKKQLFAENVDRRDKLQIFADIIRVSANPSKTTRILRLANIQYNTFQDCVDKLCKSGMLEKVSITNKRKINRDQRTRYTLKATEMGLKWSNRVNEIYKTLEESK